jgi:hypothetical protein
MRALADDCVKLVLEASALPEAAGRISMLDMGEPVRILEMAENLIRFSGLEPYTEMPIIFTGVRPGEKLHEDLMSEVEHAVNTGRRSAVQRTGRGSCDPRQPAALDAARASGTDHPGSAPGTRCGPLSSRVAGFHRLARRLIDWVDSRRRHHATGEVRGTARIP